MASAYGNAKLDGGTQYAGNWYVADSTGALIAVYKSDKIGILDLDPTEDNVVDVTGILEVFPLDAGGTQQISGESLQFSLVQSTGTRPAPQTGLSLSDLDYQSGESSLIGAYVTVPLGSYTENRQPVEFTFVDTSNGKTYYDGLSLASGGSTVLVDTYTFNYSAGNCLPTDGGQPNLSEGDFNGIFDIEETDDNLVHMVVFYGQCGT